MARAGWDNYLTQLHTFLDQTAARMNAALLNADSVLYAALLRNTPVVQWSVSGKQSVIMMRSYDHVSQDDFTELLNFLIEYALKAQEVYVPVVTVPSVPRETG